MVHIYIYISYIHIYIYIYNDSWANLEILSLKIDRTVGFHNFNIRIFNSRVSNPNKLIVDVFWHDVGFQCARVSAKENTMKFRKPTVPLLWDGDKGLSRHPYHWYHYHYYCYYYYYYYYYYHYYYLYYYLNGTVIKGCTGWLTEVAIATYCTVSFQNVMFVFAA